MFHRISEYPSPPQTEKHLIFQDDLSNILSRFKSFKELQLLQTRVLFYKDRRAE